MFIFLSMFGCGPKYQKEDLIGTSKGVKIVAEDSLKLPIEDTTSRLKLSKFKT